ncbi:MAG: chorismate synthase [Candidatus Latescibacterota bacterium]|nr:chorismate synthase [Candidatus Latescibacterota bacterium]
MEILGGSLFSVAGAGESHGPAVTTIVFGCPPGLKLSRVSVQQYLDRRRPGSSKLGTPRREGDKVVLLSGVYSEDHEMLKGPEISVALGDEEISTRAYEEGFTTGEPIAAVVLSEAKRSGDYDQLAGARGDVRPGHTDLVKHYKARGFADPRGGGRSSYRSTLSDVIGGSIARIFLREHFGTAFLSSICQVGDLKSPVSLSDHLEKLVCAAPDRRLTATQVEAVETQLSAGEIRTLDAEFCMGAAELIGSTRKQGDSIGAAVEVVGVNVPPLIGEPLYHSLKLRLMGVLGGLNAVQSCELGSGGEVVGRRGSENNDAIRRPGYQGNHHGGLLGGVTTGMPLVFRVGFKPTASILLPQQSVRKDLEEIEFKLQKGRHDPCVGVRAGVTLESRMAIEVMDAALAHQSRQLSADNFRLF